MRKFLLVLALGLVVISIPTATGSGGLTLTVVSQTSSTITLGWTPDRSGFGYLFSTKASPTANWILVSRSSDSSKSTVRFNKGSYSYEVAVIVKGNTGEYVPSPAPPPTVYACSDGIDNDNDGKIDYPADPGCVNAQDTDETDSPTPPPPTSGYPDSTNTGVPAGTTLTPVSGDLIITTAGSTVTGKDVSGVIRIQAPGVTVQNSKTAGIRIEGEANNPVNPRATIQYVEINCGGPGTKGIQATFGDNGNNFNAYHVNIHNCEDGLSVENDFTITDSYIHDLAECGTCHNDGMQIYGGSRIIIQHNRVYGTDTSAIQFCNNLTNCSPMADTLIQDNLLAGGGWTLYCPKVATTNWRIIDNKFSTIFWPKVGFFGSNTDCDGETASGNIIYETNAPVDMTT